ncbi:MAG TPA: glycosyltransferase, partial [Segetibacter sp.]
LAKAKRIGTSSGFIKNAIVEQYKLRDEKVKVTGISASAVFKPLNWEKREEIKEKYAQGCEYFIYRSVFTADGNLLNTLKAFSIFKKWQKTNMKLLIAGKIDKEDNKHLGKLSTYKYRNEIILLPALTEPELADVLGAAYAMLFLPLHPGFEMPVVEALRCELPLIISIHNSFAELAGEAALYANPANPAEISEQMKKIFKDEPLRARLIENGKHKTESHNWQNVRQAVWQLIEQSVSP